MFRRVMFLVMFMFLITGGAYAIDLPKTGQTTCYDGTTLITCTGTGQDGDTLAGTDWPSPRFIDRGDGTLQDGLTGLIWAQDADTPGPGACTGTGTAMLWQEALDHVACLNTNSYLGYNEWRLPNVNELESLFNAEVADPDVWLGTEGFTNIPIASYHSSTTRPSSLFMNFAFGFAPSTGDVGTIRKFLDSSQVWPVHSTSTPALLGRTGQTQCWDALGTSRACAGTGEDGETQAGAVWPSPRFTDNSDGTITDNLTALIWTQDANAAGPAACSNAGLTMGWQDAVDHVACLNTNNYLGHDDWRLPNRKELFSLIDVSNVNPALPSGHLFTNLPSISGRYASSTTSATNFPVGASVWYLESGIGELGDSSKLSFFSVWSVRTGGVVTPVPDIDVTDSIGTNDDLQMPFGNVTVSTNSAIETVTITNAGNADLDVSNIQLSGADSGEFTLITGGGAATCGSTAPTIAPTENCTVTVTFTPSSTGAMSASLDITSDDPDEGTVNVALSGTGDPAPVQDINVTDSLAPAGDLQMPFGDITDGTSSAAETVTISNTGNASLSVTNIQLTGADTGEFSLDVTGGSDPCGSTSLTIAASPDSCTVTITFSPTSTGAKTANLEITSDDADEGIVNVALSGTGTAVPVPDIDVTDSIAPDSDLEMIFPDTTEGTSSATETVTISNTGTASLNVTNIQLTTPHAGEFSLDVNAGASPCGSTAPTVAVAGSCTVTVTFEPTTTGLKIANLEITSNDSDEGTVNVALGGTGMPAAVNNDPSQFNLLSPADGQVDVSVPVTFEWEPATDPDGDPITYDFYTCTDPDPVNNCTPTVVASLANDTDGKIYYAGFGYGTGIMLFGIVLAGCIFGRKKTATLVGIMVITSTLLISCGVFDNHNSNPPPSAPAAANNNVSHTVPGLAPVTTYYWTVVAKDNNNGETQSSIWSYTTE